MINIYNIKNNSNLITRMISSRMSISCINDGKERNEQEAIKLYSKSRQCIIIRINLIRQTILCNQKMSLANNIQFHLLDEYKSNIDALLFTATESEAEKFRERLAEIAEEQKELIEQRYYLSTSRSYFEKKLAQLTNINSKISNGDSSYLNAKL